MGYKDSGEEWTEHENNFSALLESLSNNTIKSEEIKVNSLEEKSQTSKVRVHYHKFTRGKDLSLYSKKDLANIFGKRDLKEIKNIKQDQTEFHEEKISEVDQKSFFFNRGSMKDYFKEKLSNNTSAFILNNSIKKDNSESDSEEGRAGFGFNSEEFQYNGNGETYKSSFDDKSTKRKHDDSDNIFSSTKKIKKEKLKLPNTYNSSNYSNSKDISQNGNTSECQYSSPNYKNCENFDTDDGKSFEKENDLDLNEDICTKTRKKNPENNVYFEENSPKKPKKKKKNKDIDTDMGVTNPVFESNIVDNSRNSEISVGVENFEVTRKKSKKVKVNPINNEGINNPVFKEDTIEGFCDSMETYPNENPYEVKVKKRKEKKQQIVNGDKMEICNFTDVEQITLHENCNGNKIEMHPKKCGISNPSFEDLMNDSLGSCENLEERIVKKKKVKKSKKEIEDSSLEYQEKQIQIVSNETEGLDSHVQVKVKKNKKSKEKSIEKDPNDFQNFIVEDCNLMLNVVSKPCLTKSVKTEQTSTKVKTNNKNRKTVRFSDITQEHIIPNNELLRMMENNYEAGIDNLNFDSIQTHVAENLEGISKTLDMYQAEIENDINEKKQTTLEDIMIGEIQNPLGENEKLKDGTKLKFKYADFDTKTPMYQLNKTGAKKSYKHLIKGDIVLKFPNTNLHEIKGYASVKRK